MNTRNVIVKIAYGTIAALVIVLVGLLIYQQHLIKQMADDNASAPSTSGAIADDAETRYSINPETAAVAGNGPGAPASEVDELRYHLEATEEELEMAREDLTEELEKQAVKSSDLITMQKKMMENPTTRKMIRSTMESTLDITYGPLFEMLGLSDEEAKAFKALLVDSQMQSLETTYELMDQSLPEEEKQEAGKLLAEQKIELESQISDLLGEEKFERYEAYQERLAERQYTATFSDSLGADDALSEAQEQELIEAMYQARKAVEAEHGTGSETEFAINPEAALDKQIEQMGLVFESYTESARSVLSASQAQQFETQMKEQQEMMKIGIEMARSLYGGDGTQSSSSAP